MEKSFSDQTSTYERLYLMPKEIKAELDNIHSTSASAFATVYNWVNEFKRDRTSTCDARHSGRPIEATMLEIIDKSTILFWLIDKWKCASLLRPQVYHMHSDFNFAWTIGYEKVIGKMSAAFAACGP